MGLRHGHGLPDGRGQARFTDCGEVKGARDWLDHALRLIRADYHRSGDTHLIHLALAGLPGIDIYLKDESVHPSGSLKHRLARSLFLYGLCNGQIGPDTAIVECSSGSTAISEAYFADLLGLPFHAVVPDTTAPAKIGAIVELGGRCVTVPPHAMEERAVALTAEFDGHFMDQFTMAERVTDWRGSNNIAESLFNQLALEPHPVPEWVVVGAGTGGTSATIGRYIRYRPALLACTKLCVVDPDGSVFESVWRTGDRSIGGRPSRIEGIGRPVVSPSFVPGVIDRMISVADARSVAAAHWLSARLGRRCGASTGTNMVGVLTVAREMQAEGRRGSIATLICDGGERYAATYYNHDWLDVHNLLPGEHAADWAGL